MGVKKGTRKREQKSRTDWKGRASELETAFEQARLEIDRLNHELGNEKEMRSGAEIAVTDLEQRIEGVTNARDTFSRRFSEAGLALEEAGRRTSEQRRTVVRLEYLAGILSAIFTNDKSVADAYELLISWLRQLGYADLDGIVPHVKDALRRGSEITHTALLEDFRFGPSSVQHEVETQPFAALIAEMRRVRKARMEEFRRRGGRSSD